jgi:hypothetical protein
MPNHLLHKGFLAQREKNQVLNFVNSLRFEGTLTNHHLKELVGKINGFSQMFDLSQNEVSSKISNYQGGGAPVRSDLPKVFYNIAGKICKEVRIPNKNSFLQIVDMDEGGTIAAHYDAAFDNLINYKCNISVLSEPYLFSIEKEEIGISETDLYCFEASLYKHWTPEPFKSRRVLLSFGFMLEYEELGRVESDPRIRLSQRIQRVFQNK